MIEELVAGDQEAAAHQIGREQAHVREIAADELRMVEQVECLRADLEAVLLGEIQALQQSEVEVVDMVERQRIAAAVGTCAQRRLDVARVGVVGDVGDD